VHSSRARGALRSRQCARFPPNASRLRPRSMPSKRLWRPEIAAPSGIWLAPFQVWRRRRVLRSHHPSLPSSRGLSPRHSNPPRAPGSVRPGALTIWWRGGAPARAP
jgi:hypothetical protein